MHINKPKIIRRISDDDKTTRVSDKRPFCFKMAEELIWIILRENNVELSQDTLNFYLKKVLEDHKSSNRTLDWGFFHAIRGPHALCVDFVL